MSQPRSSSLIPQVTFGLFLLAVSVSLLGQAPAQLPSRNGGPFRIAGTVISATEGVPLSRTRVSLQDVKNRQNQFFVITGDNGRFEFTSLAAGKYSLFGAKRGYISASYDAHEQFSTAIVTGAGLDTENLTLRLAPTAVFTGRVLDEFGDPVRNATVTLWRDDHSTGVGRTVRFRTDMPDDRGAFEFAPLDAGIYFVSVVAQPWYAIHPPSVHQTGTPEVPISVDRSFDVVYVPTYYAGATEVEDASPIFIRGGDHIDLDLHLMPVPALHVIVRNPQLEGENRFSFPMLSKRDFEGPGGPPIQPEIQMIAPGVFEITAAPGKYQVRLPQSKLGPSQTAEVEISQDNQELDLSSGQAVSNITAKVQLIGETALPPRMGVGLRDSKNRIVAWQAIASTREVTFDDVIPGKYDVLALSPSRAYTVVGMTVNGSLESGHSLAVPAGTNLTLALSVIGGAADVNGVAQRAGKGAAGAMVVLVPRNPEANHELFRRDQSDFDGSFTFHSVIPGTYTVIAIESGWDLDWSRPDVISRYVAHGEKLVVSGSQRAVQLARAVEIQPK